MHVQPLGLWEENTPKTSDPGPVEAGYIEQMEILTQKGAMGPEHAGLRALVINAARAVDQIKPTDAASGKGALYKALNEIASQLPAPREEGASDIDQLRDLLKGTPGSDEPCPYDNVPDGEQ